METIIIQTDTKKAKAIKQFLKAFGVVFKTDKSPYDPDFVKKILETKTEKSTRIDPENLWESII